MSSQLRDATNQPTKTMTTTTITAGKNHGIKVSAKTAAAFRAMIGKQIKAGYTGAPRRSYWPIGSNGSLVSPLCMI
jgi:hypothetical protein